MAIYEGSVRVTEYDGRRVNVGRDLHRVCGGINCQDREETRRELQEI